ncbi:MAG TPA: phosphate ABC transporter substrate-binding protein [Candidatus Humimicrobiaceae bacterium]|nr:phosphate ABC transporter substrate-binding protein [Candidatus Humimicrobiaceae bacterium]
MIKSRSNLLILMSMAIIILFLGITIFSGCKEETAPGEEIVEEEEVAEEESEVKQFEGQKILISGSTTLLPFAEPAAAAFMDKYGGSVTIAGGGSGTGISECINEINDIANSSRQVASEEIEEAQSIGIELVEVLVAYDGISIILSGNIEGVEELSIRQLSDIFRGIITNWSDVGGPDAEIILASRDSASGTYEYFLEAVVQMGKSEEGNEFTPMALALQSNADIVNTVTTTDNAIGYIGLGYLKEALDKGAVVITVEGIEASVETVRDGTYPISRGLYNYYRKGDLNEMGLAYLDFVQSDEGQAIALDTGFVPIN